MPRGPKGKRVADADGGFSVVSKNANREGSVYYDGPSARSDGKTIGGRWRATYVGSNGKPHRVSAPTRALAEARRAEKIAQLELPTVSDHFSRKSTVSELADWWLDSVARHQVRASSLDAYRKALGYLTSELGEMAVADVRPKTITGWQSRLLDKFAPYTVLNFRKAARQVFAEAQRVGVLASNPFDLVKAPRARRVTDGRALSPVDARKLISAAGQARLGAVVTLLFCQGWRVSEVLGLAWEDLDLKAGTARIQRALAHTGVSGLVLGPTKTSGAEGVHHLAPIAIANLGARRIEQNEERLASIESWPTHICQGVPVSLVFTNTTGGFVTRQSINKLIERTARSAGIDPTGLATHAGRRTVITALYANGGLDLTDIARHVGHTSPTTTAGYVRSFGRRSEQTAQRAAELLDPSLAGS